MKYVIDAQLPKRMTEWFAAAGCEAIHTKDLLDGNRTSDARLLVLSEQEGRIVVTKDADFVDSHILTGRPEKMLLVSTGNIRNSEVELLVQPLQTAC